MEGYIRKRSDFSTSLLNVLSYDITLNSIYSETSTIVATYKSGIKQGDFVLCNEFKGIVKLISVDGNTMTLTCSDMDSVFDRLLYFDPDTDIGGFTIESFIRSAAMLNYRHCDSMYALRYMAVATPTAGTPFVMPALSDKSMFALSDYIKAVRRHGVMVNYDLTGKNLLVSFKTAPANVQKLDFMAHNTITSESYGGYSVAKVSNYVDGTPHDFYLLSNGTVSQNESDERRVLGAWEVLNDATEEAILQKFALSYGHEIEFTSNKGIPFLSPIQMKMPSGVVVDSFISAIRKQSGSAKYYYTAGELQTTLTAKLRR